MYICMAYSSIFWYIIQQHVASIPIAKRYKVKKAFQISNTGVYTENKFMVLTSPPSHPETNIDLGAYERLRSQMAPGYDLQCMRKNTARCRSFTQDICVSIFLFVFRQFPHSPSRFRYLTCNLRVASDKLTWMTESLFICLIPMVQRIIY